MSKIYKDDITGEEYKSETSLYKFSIVTEDMVYDNFDSRSPHYVADSQLAQEAHARDIAEALREIVDEWEKDTLKYIQEDESDE